MFYLKHHSLSQLEFRYYEEICIFLSPIPNFVLQVLFLQKTRFVVDSFHKITHFKKRSFFLTDSRREFNRWPSSTSDCRKRLSDW